MRRNANVSECAPLSTQRRARLSRQLRSRSIVLNIRCPLCENVAAPDESQHRDGMEAEGAVKFAGAMYNIKSASVDFFV
jgi:hypothetical protein